ncbi:C2 family cysteine protease [Brachybacterium phenoliresistens]|uniref:C2 family cysteine protease n=1 Tax=Brachybacterium phenoliresistens TaxID=396014 RepID=UPI0031D308EF
MGGFLGADTDQLIGAGETMEQRGVRLEEIGEALSAAIARASWTGPDRDRFCESFEASVLPLIREASVRLGTGARALYRHAAQQDLASSADGSIDSARYAELLEGESWSDIINWAQDAWEKTPFDDPMTIEDLGGRYVDSPEGAGFDPADVDLSAEAIGSQVMRQGTLGDCWFLAGLMAAAQSDPEFLARNITLREDGTWDVTLYEDGEPVTVTVSPDELVRDGARVDNDGSGNFWDDDEIGYMSIYEQAAINHLGPDYESVIADTPQAGLELITGAGANGSDILGGQPSAEDLHRALETGAPITVMTDPIMPFRGDLASAHVYQVQSVDPETEEVVLVNPWGDGAGKPHLVTVPMDFFYGNNIVMTGVGAPPEDWG